MPQQATLTDLDDAALLFDLYRQFYGYPGDLLAAQEFLRERLTRGESAIFLARDHEGAGTGFAQLYPSFSSLSLRPVFILYDLFVREGARKSGTAKKLLAACIAHAKDAGASGLTLSTAVDNYTAQGLYQATGWQRDEAFFTYEYEIT